MIASSVASPKRRLDPGDAAFLWFNVHQNNIRPDSFDTVPGYKKVVPTPEHAKKAAGPRNDDAADFSLWHLDFCVTYKAQPASVADTNDFFAL